ncbi:unnamed protein product [Urochloa humidicola]
MDGACPAAGGGSVRPLGRRPRAPRRRARAPRRRGQRDAGARARQGTPRDRAALLVALGGGAAPGPAAAAAPPLSVDDVPDEGLRAVLAQLKDAVDRACSACDFACLSRAHLVGALRLLNHPLPLPGGGDGVVTVKLLEACKELANARRYAQGSGQRVNAALAALML